MDELVTTVFQRQLSMLDCFTVWRVDWIVVARTSGAFLASVTDMNAAKGRRRR